MSILHPHEMHADAQAAVSVTHAMATGETLKPEMVTLGAATVLHLMRQQVLVQLLNGNENSDHVTSLASELSAVALRSKCLEVVQAVDWWHLVYTGSPLDGQFFVSRALPNEVSAYLSSVLRESPRQALAARALQAEHLNRISALEGLSNRPTPTSRQVFDALLTSNTSSVVQRLRENPRDPLSDIVGVLPDELVRRADPGGTVPRNGRRWPELVKRASELQECVEQVKITSSILARMSTKVGVVQAPTDLKPPLDSLVRTLEIDVTGDDEITVRLERVLNQASNIQTPDPGCLATIAFGAGHTLQWILEKSEYVKREAARLNERAEKLEIWSATPEVSQPFAEFESALSWGLLSDAEVWLEECEREATKAAKEHDIRIRYDKLIAMKERQEDPRITERVTILMHSLASTLDLNDLDAAKVLVESLELMLPTHQYETTSLQIAEDSAHFKAQSTAQSKSAPTTENTKPTAHVSAPLTNSGTEEIRRLARSGNIEALLRRAETEKDVAYLIRAVAAEVRWPLRPSVWPAMRKIYLKAIRIDPTLEGLILPPLPPSNLSVPASKPLLTLDVTLASNLPPIDGAALKTANELLNGNYASAATALAAMAVEGTSIEVWAWALYASNKAANPVATLTLYATLAQTNLHIPAIIAWIIAASYEWVGDPVRAELSLGYAIRLNLGPINTLKRQAAADFYKSLNKDAPTDLLGALPEITITTRETQSGSSTVAPEKHSETVSQSPSSYSMNYQQREETQARREYESGESAKAEYRLTQLLEQVPRSPGSFLLLRIYRESRRWQAAVTLIESLDRRHAASWRHFVELARVAVACDQTQTALESLRRAAALDATACEASADHQRLLAQVQDLAAREAKSVATLGGQSVSADVVNRLAVGGNLDPSDWSSVARRYVEQNRLGELLPVAEEIVNQAPWVPQSLVDVIVNTGTALAEPSERNRLLTLLAQSGNAPAILQLAKHLRSIASSSQQTEAGSYNDDVRKMLTESLEVVSPAARPRLAWALYETLRDLSLEEQAYEVYRAEFPPLPTLEPGPLESGLPRIEPVLRNPNLPGWAQPKLAEAVKRTSEGRDSAQTLADCWIAASAEAPLAISSAIGWLVAAGQPQDALRFYISRADEVYPTLSTSWNVATALAAIGRYDEAVEWFTYCDNLSKKDPSEVQRQGRDAVFLHAGRPLLARRSVVPFTTSGPVPFLGLIRDLRDRLLAGLIAESDALTTGTVAFGSLQHPNNNEKAAFAQLLTDTSQYQEAMELITSTNRDGMLPVVAAQVLVDLGARSGREREALELVTTNESRNNHSLLMIAAKLHYLLDELELAKGCAERAMLMKPKFSEPIEFLHALQRGKNPLPVAYGLKVELLYAGRIASGHAEVLLRLSARRALQNVRCVAGGRTIPFGDLEVLQSQLAHLRLEISEPGSRALRITVFYSGSEGKVGRANLFRPKVPAPRPLTLPFDPTQPVPDELFVGRTNDMLRIRDHYDNRRQIMFVGGPRQVGKTSLLRKCRLEARRDPSASTLFAMMEGDVYVVALGFLSQLAQALQQEMAEQGRDVALSSTERLSNVSAFTRWFRSEMSPNIIGKQIIVAIDEVQVMLDRLTTSGFTGESLADVAGVIRSINADDDLPIKFLFLGSCSYASVRDRLSSTNVAAEILEVEVGFLDELETADLVRRGFSAGTSAVFVLDSAQRAFWSLTAGYPNHVHLLARGVERVLGDSGERIVSEDVVLRAADALVKQDRIVVQHLLGREREREYQQRVLVALASFYGQEDDTLSAPSLRELVERLGTEYMDGIERFERLGLLRRLPDQSVHVANGLIRRWLVENSLMLELRREAIRSNEVHNALIVGGFEVSEVDSDDLGEVLLLRRKGNTFRARRAAVGVASEDVHSALLLHADEDPGTASVGFLVEWIDGWLVFAHSTGRPLIETGSLATSNWERRDTIRVVRVIQEAASVLLERNVTGRWVHGNISGRNLIDRGASGIFIADWEYGCGNLISRMTSFRPGPLRPPEQAIRYMSGAPFVPSDDVFALGGVLFHALDPSNRFPRDLGQDGCANTSQRPRHLEQVGVDADLRRLIEAMLAPEPADRPALEYVRPTLLGWINQYL